MGVAGPGEGDEGGVPINVISDDTPDRYRTYLVRVGSDAQKENLTMA